MHNTDARAIDAILKTKGWLWKETDFRDRAVKKCCNGPNARQGWSRLNLDRAAAVRGILVREGKLWKWIWGWGMLHDAPSAAPSLYSGDLRAPGVLREDHAGVRL